MVELMVVVAIIGTLSAIAVPQYRKYTSRARQSEAKVALAMVFDAEWAFYSAQGSFTACLAKAGVRLESQKRYYTVGPSAGVSATCGQTGGLTCRCFDYAPAACNLNCSIGNGSTYFSLTAKGNGSWAEPAVPGDFTKISFLVRALGNVSAQAVSDVWAIDHNKTLINEVPGI